MNEATIVGVLLVALLVYGFIEGFTDGTED